jgi:acylpyruvate hydrolase
MKIICIEGNYEKTAAKEPVFFLKPESAILRAKLPFFIPDHSQRIIPRCNIVLKVCKLGKNIQKRFAHLYYNEIGIGLDMEAAYTLQQCIKNGLPWEVAKAYDFSSPVGSFIPVKEFSDISKISFSMSKNEKCLMKSSTAEMLFSFDEIISYVSNYMTIKTGDYIFTGSPPIHESITINDTIDCFIEEKKMLSLRIK